MEYKGQEFKSDSKIITPASTTGNASLNIPHGTAPTSPVNGDVWSTTSYGYIRINGSSRAFGHSTVGQAEAEAGTATTGRVWTAQRVNQAITALASVKSVAGKTGDVTLVKADVGLGNVDNVQQETPAGAQAKVDTHAGDQLLHKQSNGCTQTGINANAEGSNTTASGNYSHAEGYSTTASGFYSHAEGNYTTANNYYSHAEGTYTIASGNGSHAEGFYTTAGGNYSHAAGVRNTAKYAQTAIGRNGTISAASDTDYSASNEAFMIGNGTAAEARGLAFKVLFDGRTYADGAYSSTGADYAEMFEWLDGNTDDEDRVGYFVTLDGDKIRKATSDDYILGVVSATPTILGDDQDDHWQGKYLVDEWGRIQYHEVIVPEERIDTVVISPEHTEIQPIYNPDWDSSIPYISRKNRKEWSAVGLMGKMLVRDDGTCQANGFCKPDDDGIATNNETGYRVMKRVAENIVQIMLK